MRWAIGNKKIILCLVLAVAFLIAGINLCVGNAVVYAEASAQTIVASHEIYTPSDLAALADEINKGLRDGYYGITVVLKNDIDISTLCNEIDKNEGWIPIGTSDYPFKGIFDGNGYTIKGLYVNKENTDRIGLFGSTHFNATISNLTVEGYVKGNNYTGGIVGYNQAKIENCINKAEVSSKDGAMHLGGIVGYNSGYIVRSGNTGDIDVGFVNFVGGIAGSNIGSIKECYNHKNLFTTDSVIGAIAGNNSAEGTIEVCLNGSKLSGKASVGGIVGNNYGIIKNVFNSGSINSVNGTAGGITGYNDVGGNVSYVLCASEAIGAEDVAAVCGYNLGIVNAAFYDKTIYKGALLNGLAAENSAGIETRILAHTDVLNSANKLSMLTDSNSDIWVKDSSEQTCTYPQLKYFFDNLASVSAEVCNIDRLQIESKDIALSETSFVYDGDAHNVDVYYNSIFLELNQDYKIIYDDNVNAGDAGVNLTFINSYKGSAEKNFVINKSPLTVEWSKEKYVYDGAEHMPALSVIDGLVDGESVTFDYSELIAINAGEYYINADLADTSVNSNYAMSMTGIAFEIAQAVITVGWTSEDFVYNGELQMPTAYVSTGRVGNDEITFRYESIDNINAGEQHVTAFLQDTLINRNYKFSGDTCTYNIEKQPIRIEWDDADFYYNGRVQYPKAIVSYGAVNDQEIILNYHGYENNIAANEEDGYVITASLAQTDINGNYRFDDESHLYFIRRVPLTIAWWDTILEYTGLPQYPSFYIAEGLVGEDEILFDLSDYSHNINASSGNAYTIQVGLAESDVNSNYYLSKVSKTYDIVKADFDINSVEFRSRTLGYDGEPKRIVIEEELPIGVSVIYDNNVITDIGEYNVKAKFSVDIDNYNALKNDTLQLKVYIAQMVFEDTSSGVIVVNKGAADSSLRLELTLKQNSSIKESGKQIFISYEVDFGKDTAEYSVPISEKLQKRNGLKVLCKNSSEEVFSTDYVITDGMLIFSAEDVVEFAIATDRDFTALWITLGIFGAVTIAIGIVLICLHCKRRKSSASVYNLAEHSNISISATSMEDVEVYTSEKEYSSDKDKLSENKGQEVQNNGQDVLTISRVTQMESMGGESKKEFVFDGVKCISFDWFIKSLNVKSVVKQERICAGDRYALMLFEAKPRDIVYWQGKRYRIGSVEYNTLIKRARETADEKS